MFQLKHLTNPDGSVSIQDPTIAPCLFGTSKTAIVWLLIRL